MLHRAALILTVTAPLLAGPTLLAMGQKTPADRSARQIIIRVDGASCPFCAFGLEKRLGRLEGVEDVRLEMKAGKVIVTLREGATVSEKALREAVDEAGFTPREILYPDQADGEAAR